MLIHLPSGAFQSLLNTLNKIWLTGNLLPSWRQSHIVPIPKAGTDSSDPSNYRPIALTSCVCRVMERMVNNTGAVLVCWQPIGRRYSWWATGAAPASLIPVVAVVFYLRFVRCHNKRIFIYLFIFNRLVWFLERNKLITPMQSGFRKCRSTTDQLVRLETFVREAFIQKQHAAVIFFDLEKAYDTTWTENSKSELVVLTLKPVNRKWVYLREAFFLSLCSV